MKNMPTVYRIVAAAVVLAALGAGLLVWMLAPDQEPADRLEPSTSIPADAPERSTTLRAVPATTTAAEAGESCCDKCKHLCDRVGCGSAECSGCHFGCFADSPNVGCTVCSENPVGYSGGNGDTPPALAPCLVAALEDTNGHIRQAVAQIMDLPPDQAQGWYDDNIVVNLDIAQADVSNVLDGKAPPQGAVCGVHARLLDVLETGYPAAGTPIADSLLDAATSLAATGYDCARP